MFDHVKDALSQAIALCYPDYTNDWILRTDGSKLGVGGCLVQLIPQEDGSIKEEVIALVSHKLSEVASRWSIYEIELYALIFCIKTWSALLYGKSFTAQVDHRDATSLSLWPTKAITSSLIEPSSWGINWTKQRFNNLPLPSWSPNYNS